MNEVATRAVGTIEVHDVVCEGLVGEGMQGSVLVVVLTVAFVAVDPMDEGVLEGVVKVVCYIQVRAK